MKARLPAPTRLLRALVHQRAQQKDSNQSCALAIAMSPLEVFLRVTMVGERRSRDNETQELCTAPRYNFVPTSYLRPRGATQLYYLRKRIH